MYGRAIFLLIPVYPTSRNMGCKYRLAQAPQYRYREYFNRCMKINDGELSESKSRSKCMLRGIHRIPLETFRCEAFETVRSKSRNHFLPDDRLGDFNCRSGHRISFNEEVFRTTQQIGSWDGSTWVFFYRFTSLSLFFPFTEIFQQHFAQSNNGWFAAITQRCYHNISVC